MSNEDIVVAGDRVELARRQGETFKTIVGDIAGDGSMLAVMPSQNGKPASVDVGDELRMYFYRQSGRYGMDVTVSGFTMSNDVRLIRLRQVSEPSREQRRENYRLPASLRTLVLQYTDEDVPPQSAEESSDEIAYTNDISVSGVSLKTRQTHYAGERMLLKVYLNWPDENAPPLDIYAEVRRVSLMPDADGYHVGLLFIQLSDEDNETIKRFVAAQQQKRIRQQRLIDGD